MRRTNFLVYALLFVLTVSNMWAQYQLYLVEQDLGVMEEGTKVMAQLLLAHEEVIKNMLQGTTSLSR